MGSLSIDDNVENTAGIVLLCFCFTLWENVLRRYALMRKEMTAVGMYVAWEISLAGFFIVGDFTGAWSLLLAK